MNKSVHALLATRKYMRIVGSRDVCLGGKGGQAGVRD